MKQMACEIQNKVNGASSNANYAFKCNSPEDILEWKLESGGRNDVTLYFASISVSSQIRKMDASIAVIRIVH